MVHVNHLSPMKTEKRKTGDVGEDLVCEYLGDRGYTILERNYLRPWGELDIVARRDSKIHFIEVKTVTREPREWPGEPTRGQSESHRPEENMHPRKIQRLHRAMQTYLLGHKALSYMDFQLDLACVYLSLNTRTAKIELIENIVL